MSGRDGTPIAWEDAPTLLADAVLSGIRTDNGFCRFWCRFPENHPGRRDLEFQMSLPEIRQWMEGRGLIFKLITDAAGNRHCYVGYETLEARAAAQVLNRLHREENLVKERFDPYYVRPKTRAWTWKDRKPVLGKTKEPG